MGWYFLKELSRGALVEVATCLNQEQRGINR